ncbi:MAG TPA: SDR family oxidoreductase [Alphaproteobacteria bacterium]|jgi:NADP-dependent 3-hydroxy acid dehydrogenase YdfG
MSKPLAAKVAWITGAGSGIGQAGAFALAEDGATVVLSGRRRDALEATARQIAGAGGRAEVELLDVADARAVEAVAAAILKRHGHVDILINSAGLNVTKRNWDNVDADGWDTVVGIDLDGAFYVTRAVLVSMRARQEGLVINVSSWAGRYDSFLTGPAYNAAKHGLVAMNAHLNMAEGKNGIRACVICPGEVNTPILDKRPIPVPPEVRAKMLQPRDMGETIRFLARLPAHVCISEMVIAPTNNRLWMNPVG